METSTHLIQFPHSELIQCPVCEQSHVQTTIETDTFTYGVDSEAVKLTVTIPVRTCNDCGFRFTDDVAEEIEHEAICQYLGMMTPKEIAKIRQRYQLSQTSFSELTRIEENLLTRWENGELIQNAALDNFLYLLTFPENLERLKMRYTDDNPIIPKQRLLG